MRDDLIALAERLEIATGRDRYLDAEIEIAVHGFPERAYQQRNGMRSKGSAPLDRVKWLAEWDATSYSTSVDSAMALIPSGWGYGLDYSPVGKVLRFVLGSPQAQPRLVCGEAMTLARSIAAAALRARSAIRAATLAKKGE